MNLNKLISQRRADFEAWFDCNVQNAKRDRYFQELRDTTTERVRRQTHPQCLPDRTPVVQDIRAELYPAETVYEFSAPDQLVPLWADCSRERFGDDGSLKAAVAYYILWWRLRNPYRWRGVPFISGDQGRFNGMFEKKGFDYLNAREESMDMTNKRQMIVYGAPGTGKSFRFKKATANNKTIRTTFHPDSDYSTFVGAYKPTMKGDKIEYAFREQAFMQAYVQAWQFKAEQKAGLGCKPVFLVVEEINRGNCAQVFGDLFQLLDRNGAGFSVYPISSNTDIETYLKQALGGLHFEDPAEQVRIDEQFEDEDDVSIVADVLSGKKLVLPDNLYIWATMNTSDQSLFPIDSAFKRRWDWEYVPIREGKKDDGSSLGWEIVAKDDQDHEKRFSWWDFLKKVNGLIFDTVKSEDKQMGYFFVKLGKDETKISAKTFVNKVLFYLYRDVFKDWDMPDKFKEFEFKDFFGDEPGSVNESKVVELLNQIFA